MILTYEMFAVPLAAFFAAVLSGLGGFGGALLLVIVLTPIVGVKAVIPLISVFAACNNLSRVFIYRKEIVWRTAIYFTLASLPGVYFGAKLLEWMSESLLLLILGLILIFAIPLGRKLKKTDFRVRRQNHFCVWRNLRSCERRSCRDWNACRGGSEQCWPSRRHLIGH